MKAGAPRKKNEKWMWKLGHRGLLWPPNNIFCDTVRMEICYNVNTRSLKIQLYKFCWYFNGLWCCLAVFTSTLPDLHKGQKKKTHNLWNDKTGYIVLFWTPWFFCLFVFSTSTTYTDAQIAIRNTIMERQNHQDNFAVEAESLVCCYCRNGFTLEPMVALSLKI